MPNGTRVSGSAPFRPSSWGALPRGVRSTWHGGCRGAALLLAAYGGGLAWLFSLALVDGRAGIGRILDTEVRVPAHCPGHHRPSGHPSGVRLTDPVRRAGRRHRERELAAARGGTSAGSTVVLRAARPARSGERPRCRHRGHADRGLHGRGRPRHLAVAGAEMAARRAAPFLVFGPAAIWQAVSADAMFAAVAAWGSRRSPPQRPVAACRGRSWPGCCSATA